MQAVLYFIVGVITIIGIPIIAIIGLIKPNRIIPERLNIRKPRLTIILSAIVLFLFGAFLLGLLEPHPLPQIGKAEKKVVLNDSIIASSYSQKFNILYNSIVSSDSPNQNGIDLFNDLDILLKDWNETMNNFDSSKESLPLSKVAYEEAALKYAALGDSILASSYTQQFETLYNQLIGLDSQPQEGRSRGELINAIEDLLFNKWWNTISTDDSLSNAFPLSQKAYFDAQKRFDGPYARYCIYGDEITSDVEYWAKIRAEEALKKVCVDPKSLVIEESICEGKTKKGYKCRVIYRAKNGFGGYVRESVSLIMAYDVDSKVYQCIDIH